MNFLPTITVPAAINGNCRAVFVCILFSLAGDGKTESRDFPVCALGNAHATGVCDTHSNLPSDYHMQNSHPKG